MAKAPASGRVLSDADAAVVKGMIARGDRQHDIAAYFAVNGGRIGETSTGDKFADVSAVTHDLPPSAPYLVLDADLLELAVDLRDKMKSDGIKEEILASMDRIISAMNASRAARGGC